MAKGTFYLHFSSKTDVLMRCARFVERLDGIVATVEGQRQEDWRGGQAALVACAAGYLHAVGSSSRQPGIGETQSVHDRGAFPAFARSAVRL
ncbi:hypothetical protein [Rhizobium aegyptiacum]|uniref:hypothetical protein n=1 Tax=Rhizobium aegyptiacum TaxID=1764550 RepID=UPI0007E54822|nr:hypothetical protein [Rhizobium aegyptiacum]